MKVTFSALASFVVLAAVVRPLSVSLYIGTDFCSCLPLYPPYAMALLLPHPWLHARRPSPLGHPSTLTPTISSHNASSTFPPATWSTSSSSHPGQCTGQTPCPGYHPSTPPPAPRKRHSWRSTLYIVSFSRVYPCRRDMYISCCTTALRVEDH